MAATAVVDGSVCYSPIREDDGPATDCLIFNAKVSFDGREMTFFNVSTFDLWTAGELAGMEPELTFEQAEDIVKAIESLARDLMKEVR